MNLNPILKYSLVTVLVLPGIAAASGFALIEQNASGLGNAYAGGAAIAEDASTIFYNPAGMSRLPGKQLAVAVNAIKPSVRFSGTGIPGNNNMGGDAGSLAYLPNAYFSMAVQPKLTVGVGLNVPFGLETSYDPGWTGRHQAIKSRLETINLNPSVAYQFSDNVSIGAGVDYQRIKGELTSFAGGAGTFALKGDDSGWGYNLGTLIKIDPSLRAGIAYRSGIRYTLRGEGTFSAAPGGNGPMSLNIEMPQSISGSLFRRLNERWDTMVDLSWTGWGAFKQLQVLRSSGAVVQTVPQDWRNTWRVSAGASHHYNEQWTLRGGVAFDQTPVSDQYRSARIPDADRYWLSLGGQYKPTSGSAVDFGYAHLFVKDASINSQSPPPALVGSYSNSVDILSLQYTHSF
ncbi:MAG: outer membrane protein transport protein [Pseudomonadota bacterium]